jgi:hypothetical protein
MLELDAPQQPEPQPRRNRLGFFAGLVAGVLGTGLAAALIVAAVGAGAQTPSPSPTAPAQKAPGFGRHFRGFGGFGFGGALHGEFTVPGPNGGYQTLAMQTGSVTAVSGSSVTVKSDDGYTKSYIVDGNTLVDAGQNGIGSVKKGDSVRVLAIVSGSATHAVRVDDVTNIGRLDGRWLPMRPRRQQAPGSAPESSPATFSQTSYAIGA